MSWVEDALRSQRKVWREIAARMGKFSERDLPPEPPERILLFGVGSSYHAARLTQASLLRAQKFPQRFRNIPILACPSLAVERELRPQRRDWAFAFSHRGKTPVTLAALEACNRAGSFTFLVAGEGVLPVVGAENAREVLHTSALEQAEPHTISVTGAVCAVTSLLMREGATEEWEALAYASDPEISRFRDRVGNGPSVILGEFEGEWVAREGALKLMEMARLPVRAFSSEEFFHGPKMSVGVESLIWHCATSEDRRAPQIHTALEVSVSTHTPLAWVSSLVEMQWLSLAVALNRNLNPDGI